MSIPVLGTLVDANLREAWPNEALNFTPWLADHLNHLAEAIGIPLELEGREVPVTTFSADILARNLTDDTRVLIENQLEVTDHSHLGQILTYLAGLDARTVIWIAADFREAHLSAVRWLNDNTVESFAFFAVKVRVVRIADSPFAPIFEVLVRPNQWERRLQTVAQESGPISEIGQFRRDFWSHYVNRYPDEQNLARAGADSNRWRYVPGTNLVVSGYLADGRVGVYIRGRRGVQSREIHAILAPHAERLATLTGVELGLPDDIYHFLQILQANTADRSTWDELAEWLYTMTNKYASALQEIGEINGHEV